jgi:hypothetical protein
MSFLSRCSIASRFSGRSERGKVFLGSDESLRTKGRPDMYTDYPETCKESFKGAREKTAVLPMGSSRVEIQMTCDGELSDERALRIERMALSP